MVNRASTSDRGLSAIVLAAGLSRRMGGKNKLLLPVDGVPLVVRSVAAIRGYPFVEVVVVTGHESAKVEEALAPFPVRFAFNGRYEDGQMTSVRTGLEALSRPVRGVLVCLADQPKLTAEDLTVLGEAFLERQGCAVLVPTFGGARGNPIVLARESMSVAEHEEALKTEQPDAGTCRAAVPWEWGQASAACFLSRRDLLREVASA